MTTVIRENNVIEQLFHLEQERDQTQKVLQEAQEALDAAKGDLKKTGKYSDPSWFASTKTAVRNKTAELHTINRKIKEFKSQLSRSNPKASYFQEAAKKVLDPTTYDKINYQANEWLKHSSN
jgi:methyl-accepting chemotaxis protein